MGDKKTEPREGRNGQAGVRAEPRRVTSGAREAPRGRGQVGETTAGREEAVPGH